MKLRAQTADGQTGWRVSDILRDIRERTELPLGAYQVSGEYAMIKFAAQAGAIDEEKVILESLGAIKRAGAT